MKKHLLFAAMLAIGATSAIATPVANMPAVTATDGTLATEEEYQTLVKSIEDVQNDLQTKLTDVQTRYPLAESLIGALKATLNGEGSLDEILTEVKAKHDAGTLTSEEVKNYQTTVNSYSQTFSGESYDQALKEAATEHYQGLLYQYAEEAKDKITEAEENLPDGVYDYYSSAMDAYGSEIDNLKWTSEVTSEEQINDLKKQFNDLADKAVALAEAAPAANALLKEIKETLPTYKEQIAKGKNDFPDYDWETATEAVAYWQKLANELSDYIDEDATAYSKSDIADFAEEFSYFKDADPYAMAQKEAWQADYFAKYYPVSQHIDEVMSELDATCPTVGANYMEKLEDLTAEMTMASMKFYGDDPISEEEFKQMLARVDEISKEADNILEEAKKAEALATGIDGISVDQLSKDSKIYSLDGKRISNAKKGVFIVNGKKVVLK